jgi:hypothetical protein
MPADLHQLFEAVRGDTMNQPLAEPAILREEAQRRARARRAIAIAAAALVIGFAGGAAIAFARPVPTPPPVGTSPSVTVPSTTPAPAPSTAPSTDDNPPRAAGEDCRPGDLDPRPFYGFEGAAGSHYSAVLVRNISATSCRLRTYPTLRYTDPAGQVHSMPATRDPSQPAVTLAPGRYASFYVRVASGNPFESGDPRCGQPQDYRGMSVVLADNRSYPLPELRISFQCGTPRVSPWGLFDRSPDTLANPTRAPAPSGP